MRPLRDVPLVLLTAACQAQPFGHTPLAPETHGRSAPPAQSVWSPGDDIPGWEDYDCGEPAGGAGYVEMEMPDVAQAYMARFGGSDPDYAHLDIGVCNTPPCAEDGEFLSIDQPSAAVRIQSVLSLVDARGQGLYGPSATYAGRNEFYLDSMTLIGEYDNSDEPGFDNVAATFCLSRVRPDMMEGTIRLDPWPGRIENEWYSSVIILIHIVIPFADHAGVDVRYPYDTGAPADAEFIRFLYRYGYDEAWPWDEITDPAIRAAVYDRYLPWNTP